MNVHSFYYVLLHRVGKGMSLPSDQTKQKDSPRDFEEVS